jgi:uncharacterized phage protein gp47/JayE
LSTSSIPGIPTTSVPPVQFTPQGVTIPTDTDILAGVQIDINYAFGGGVNPKLTTPQGQLASSTAAIVADKDGEIALICNQVDPQYATGRFQDAIGRLYFMTRNPATSTVVACVLTGLVDTPVPAGTLAQDTSNNTYVLLASVTIGDGGTVMSSWANIATGPIPCPATTLTRVYQAVPGWDTISNPEDGELGQNVESPNEFEFRRQQSVALNGRGTCPSINAEVFAVANVLDCYVIDNPSGVTVNKGSTNYPLAPHSVYVAVVGGVAADIAQAIWNKKDGGCNYNGNTSETVLDMDYEYPQPAYVVSFEIPAALPILFAVQILNNPSLPANIVALVQAAVIAQFNGTNGSQRARIGSLVLATSYYGAIASVANNVMIVSVLIGTAAPTAASVQIGIDQAPSIAAGNISVTLI